MWGDKRSSDALLQSSLLLPFAAGEPGPQNTLSDGARPRCRNGVPPRFCGAYISCFVEDGDNDDEEEATSTTGSAVAKVTAASATSAGSVSGSASFEDSQDDDDDFDSGGSSSSCRTTRFF